MNANRKVVLEGHGTATLTAANHLATGGEGAAYRVGNFVVKVYTDGSVMRREHMDQKIQRLAQVSHAGIVSPRGLVLEHGAPAGYYMRHIDGEGLSRVFTNTFWKREGFGTSHAIELVHKMREIVSFAHGEGAVLVDANEMNWLTTGRGTAMTPHVIDVDSWMIDQWQARAIMPSIRDWHSNVFTELSDWFSWGVVTFQIFSGIHPYKGTLSGYKRGDLEGRMKKNASVFTNDIGLNNAVRDFTIIPGPLLDWYRSVFQDGERSMPPSPHTRAVATATLPQKMRMRVTSVGALVMEKVLFGYGVVRLFPCGVALTADGRVYDLYTKRVIAQDVQADSEIVRLAEGWLIATWSHGRMLLRFVHGVSFASSDVSLQVDARQIVRSEDRLFVVTRRGLSELMFTSLGSAALATIGQTWSVVGESTQWFDGVGVQDALGATYVIVPFGEKACAHVRVPELDGLKVITAIAGPRFVRCVVLDAQGAYRQCDVAFTRDYRQYAVTFVDVDSAEISAAILPKGVVASIVDDGVLEIVVPSRGVRNVVRDQYIRADLSLARVGDAVHAIDHSGDLWRMRMT